MKSHSLRYALMAAVCALALPGAASAALAVTGDGATLGFSLSTFASMPQNGPYGAWGSATLSNGNIVVNGYNSANIGQTVNYVFHDVDGQTPATAINVSPWNDDGYASALVRLNGVVYGTEYGNYVTRVVNADGSEGTVISNAGRGGIGASVSRNSLIVATNNGLEEIDLSNPDPTSNHHSFALAGNGSIDGVTVSVDGTTAYFELGEHIYGYRIADGVQVYDSGYLGGADGVGIITSGVLAGQLIVNSNFGYVQLINTADNHQTTIASGGSRGDYVGFDINNGTLFLSQSDSLLRLSLANGTIGGGGDQGGGVPEPASWALMIVGLGGVGALMRRRRTLAFAA